MIDILATSGAVICVALVVSAVLRVAWQRISRDWEEPNLGAWRVSDE